MYKNHCWYRNINDPFSNRESMSTISREKIGSFRKELRNRVRLLYKLEKLYKDLREKEYEDSIGYLYYDDLVEEAQAAITSHQLNIDTYQQ